MKSALEAALAASAVFLALAACSNQSSSDRPTAEASAFRDRALEDNASETLDGHAPPIAAMALASPAVRPVQTPPQVETSPLRIAVSRDACVAPCHIQVSAVYGDGLTVDDRFHDRSYTWDFGDPGGDFDALPDDFPLSRSSANGLGPISGHLFETAGERTIAVEATGEEDRHLAETTVRIVDPDEFYAGSRTIVVSQTGDFEGAPRGAKKFERLDRAFAAWAKTRGGARLLLRAGERFLLERQYGIRGRDGADSNFQLGRFGDGPRPKIAFDFQARGDKGKAKKKGLLLFDLRNTTIYGIYFAGDYDPRTGLGATRKTDALDAKGQLESLTIADAKFAGFRNVFRGSVRDFGFVNNVVEDWADYGVTPGHVGDCGVLLLGNAFRLYSGPADYSAEGAEGPRHGPIRIGHACGLVASRNFIKTGNNIKGDGRNQQPTMRLNGQGVGGHASVVAGNYLIGGNTVMTYGAANSRYDVERLDAKIVGNVFQATRATKTFITAQHTTMTIARNAFVQPPVPGANMDRAISLERPPKSTPSNDAGAVYVRDNVFIARLDNGRRMNLIEYAGGFENTMSVLTERNAGAALNRFATGAAQVDLNEAVSRADRAVNGDISSLMAATPVLDGERR